MTERTIRQDKDGVYLITNGEIYRPGPLYYTLRPGLAYNDGGLKPGDKVDARMINSTPIVKIMLGDGSERYWECESSRKSAQARGSRPAWM